MEQKNIFIKLLKEAILGLIGVLGMHIETKLGIAVYLLILSLGILLSPKSEDINYNNQLIIGFVILIFSSLLVIWRIKELKKQVK